MSTEFDEIVKGRGEIEKSKPKFMKIVAGFIFIIGCFIYVLSIIRDWNGNTTGLFFISLGLLWFIIFILTKLSKANFELIDRIREIVDKSKNSDPQKDED